MYPGGNPQPIILFGVYAFATHIGKTYHFEFILAAPY